MWNLRAQAKTGRQSTPLQRFAALALLAGVATVPARHASGRQLQNLSPPFAITTASTGPVHLPGDLAAAVRYELDYRPEEVVRGVVLDLDGDGHLDWVIRGAERMCGNGGCPFLIADGGSRKVIGAVFGAAIYLVDIRPGRRPVVGAYARSGDTVTWTTFTFNGREYARASQQRLSGATADSLNTWLGKGVDGTSYSGRPALEPFATFRSEPWGFAVSYPADWNVAERPNGPMVGAEPSPNEALFTVIFEEPGDSLWPGRYEIQVLRRAGGVGLEGIVERLGLFDFWNGSPRDTVIAGQPAKTWVRWEADALVREVLVMGAASVILLRHDESAPNDPAFSRHQSLYALITSSVTIDAASGGRPR